MPAPCGVEWRASVHPVGPSRPSLDSKKTLQSMMCRRGWSGCSQYALSPCRHRSSNLSRLIESYTSLGSSRDRSCRKSVELTASRIRPLDRPTDPSGGPAALGSAGSYGLHCQHSPVSQCCEERLLKSPRRSKKFVFSSSRLASSHLGVMTRNTHTKNKLQPCPVDFSLNILRSQTTADASSGPASQWRDQ